MDQHAIPKKGSIEDDMSQQTAKAIEKLRVEDSDKSNEKEYQLTKEERYSKQVEMDSRSIFVGNITQNTTVELLEQHFWQVGSIKRVTILYNKYTSVPKGYSYIEFDVGESVTAALKMNETEIDGSKITVSKKRTNLPGFKHFNYQSQNNNFLLPGFSCLYKNINFYPHYPFQYNNKYNDSHNGKGNFRGGYKGSYKKNNSKVTSFANRKLHQSSNQALEKSSKQESHPINESSTKDMNTISNINSKS